VPQDVNGGGAFVLCPAREVVHVESSETPRIEPLPEDSWDEDIRTLVEQNWMGNPPGGRIALYRTMVRHRELFRAWSNFGRVVLNSRLPERDRELLILRTVWHARGRYPWAQHESLARRNGFTAEEIEWVLDGPDAPGWKEYEATLLAAVDELHSTGTLSDAVWDRLRSRYDDEELIEIPVIVAEYQLVSYVTNALRIAPPPELPVLPTRPAT
jgi:alkylhydroperoxidase family enzyme